MLGRRFSYVRRRLVAGLSALVMHGCVDWLPPCRGTGGRCSRILDLENVGTTDQGGVPERLLKSGSDFRAVDLLVSIGENLLCTPHQSDDRRCWNSWVVAVLMSAQWRDMSTKELVVDNSRPCNWRKESRQSDVDNFLFSCRLDSW